MRGIIASIIIAAILISGSILILNRYSVDSTGNRKLDRWTGRSYILRHDNNSDNDKYLWVRIIDPLE